MLLRTSVIFNEKLSRPLSPTVQTFAGRFGIAKARGQVIVDHSDRLHERIDDGRSYKVEPAFFQVFRDPVRNIS